MSEHLNEKLSRLMDGEAEAGDSRIIDELIHDRSSQETWWRYHLVSDVLKHESITLVHRELKDRIAARLENEPAILAPKAMSHRNWVRPVAGFAIAASVAVVAVLGIQQKGEEVSTGSSPQVAQNAAPQPVVAPVAPVARQFNAPARLASIETLEEIVIPTRVNSNLNSYLLNYNEFRTTETKMQGILPYVRIIAHENDN